MFKQIKFKNKKQKYGVIGLGALLGLVFVLSIISNIFAGDKPSDEGDVTYDVATLRKQEPVSIEGISVLESDSSYYYDPSRGEIESIYVKTGDKVQKGDTLFTYRQEAIDEELEDAQREKNRLYAKREQLVKQLSQLTGKTYNFQGDCIDLNQVQGKQSYAIIEPINQDFDEADMSVVVQASDATAVTSDQDGSTGLKDQIKELNYNIEDVEIKLMRLKKKQHGPVKAKFAGEVVFDQTGVFNSNVPLVRLVSGQNTLIQGNVSEYEYYLMQEDRPVDLHVKAEDRKVQGKITHFDKFPPISNGAPLASPTSEGAGDLMASASKSQSEAGQFGFSILADDFIQPGFSVNIKIAMPGLVIPKDAIIKENNQNYVFVYHEGKVKKTAIDLERQGAQMVVQSGLKAGDQLIQFPQHLKDGQSVQINQDQEQTN
ncbi:efflux RND transporter periplasmic adaptor subunit [Vaginisenegalia massiliensis]|uniref:efflux RND transporter periplasmic adaptor subunit n=1 Tax=Vaginisenegalia massiliensis TaxID=2058294 RepID=UPI0013DDFF66|nr:biotin/lipoyl-binding protein [Vaginisenegalia massiliensis]